MPTNLNDKSVLVYDLSGTYSFIAERLAKDFSHVYYFSQFVSGFSDVAHFLPGLGLPEIEKIADPFEDLSRFDMAVFTDVGQGGIQKHFRSIGIPVFGSADAQILELDRYYFKQSLEEAEMPVAEYRVVVGLDDLRKILMKEKDLYVKFSYFRGAMETFHHRSWAASETWLNNLGVILGPYSKIAQFIVEEPIEDDEAVEVGYDGYCVGGEIPENSLWGYEVKDAAYVGTTNSIPDRLFDSTLNFARILKQYDYRGFLSTELRVTRDNEFLIDPTLRCPSPPSEIECAMMTNFSDVVWEGAHGNLVDPEYSNRYAAMLVLKSDFIVDHALSVDLGDSDRVYLHGHFRIDGKDFSIVADEYSEFGGAVGLGDTLEEAVGEAIDAAESVNAYQLQFSISSLDDAMEAIEKGNDLGLTWNGTTEQRLKAAIGG